MHYGPTDYALRPTTLLCVPFRLIDSTQSIQLQCREIVGHSYRATNESIAGTQEDDLKEISSLLRLGIGTSAERRALLAGDPKGITSSHYFLRGIEYFES